MQLVVPLSWVFIIDSRFRGNDGLRWRVNDGLGSAGMTAVLQISLYVFVCVVGLLID